MKIFGLYIYTRKGLEKVCHKNYEDGVNRGVEMQNNMIRCTLHPVVHSLEELRNNTWDVERVDHAIKWLESCYD